MGVLLPVVLGADSGTAEVMITIRAAGLADLPEIRTLFQEYAASLPIDLEFQGFAEELGGLPGIYSPPKGRLFLGASAGRPAGCVGVRPLDTNVCEMKRLFVRPAERGRALGRALAETAVAFGRAAGYGAMRLDTLPTMTAARSLYRRLGFREVAPYRDNPVPGAVFMELLLEDLPD